MPILSLKSSFIQVLRLYNLHDLHFFGKLSALVSELFKPIAGQICYFIKKSTKQTQTLYIITFSLQAFSQGTVRLVKKVFQSFFTRSLQEHL